MAVTKDIAGQVVRLSWVVWMEKNGATQLKDHPKITIMYLAHRIATVVLMVIFFVITVLGDALFDKTNESRFIAI